MWNETCLCLQRHVARALWHLATAAESRPLVVDCGGVPAIQRLAQAPEVRSLQSKKLAQRALKRLADDPAVCYRLSPEIISIVEAYNAQSQSQLNLPKVTTSLGLLLTDDT